MDKMKVEMFRSRAVKFELKTGIDDVHMGGVCSCDDGHMEECAPVMMGTWRSVLM